MSTLVPTRARHILAIACAAALAGCGHLPHVPTPHMPSLRFWHHRAPAAPQPVQELTVSDGNNETSAYPQFWKRNTLVIDLRAVSGTGSLELTPREGNGWPTRLAFRVTPGAIGQLEVKGAQRTVFPIATAAEPPVDLELAPGVYTLKTPQITVSWTP